LERETLTYEDGKILNNFVNIFYFQVKQLIGPPKYGNKQFVDLPEDVLPDLPNHSEMGTENKY
jgi:hypothetical protein